MSTQANLIGIGKYHKALQKYFHYDLTWYEDFKHEDPVIVKLFYCNSKSSSNDLADALGLGGFEDQKIKNDKINWPKLQDFVSEYSYELMDLIKFQIFIDHGFQFYFDLNA